MWWEEMNVGLQSVCPVLEALSLGLVRSLHSGSLTPYNSQQPQVASVAVKPWAPGMGRPKFLLN